jgi:uncharacterized lipoprotein YmbA
MTRLKLAAVATLMLALAACSPSPNPNLYVLAAMPGPVLHTPSRSIELRRIGLAAYLDRPGIVRSQADYQLSVMSNDRWGEPLGTMLGRVFAENLVQRLPDAVIFNEDGAISTDPDTVVEIDIQRFDADAQGNVTLLAQVAARRSGSRAQAQARTFRLTATPASTSTADLVAALSHTLAELSDNLAAMLARR